jgi:threonine/homoserine/homoserine lactone efflux protein
MDLWPFVLGITIGLAVAAPLGPVNLIVIRSALRRGLAGGLAAGSGAVLADSFYGAIAAFGFHSIEQAILRLATPLQLGGGLVLVAIGVHTARHHVQLAEIASTREPALAAQLSRKLAATFTLTITNPGSLLGMLAMFGALGGPLALGLSTLRPAAAVAGIALGGVLWWLLLSTLISRFKAHVTSAMLDRINRWAGILIAAFGFALLMELGS